VIELNHKLMNWLRFKYSTWLWRPNKPHILNPLRIVELLYRFLYFTRQFLVVSLCPPKPHSKPVWIVGNLSVGGEGKTPFVIALVEYLLSKGFNPGIVSRGYGRKGSHLVVVSDESIHNEVGDEPLMMHAILKGKVPIAVSANRSLAIDYLIKNKSCDIVISDDGLQNPNIYRDVEFLVMDANRRIGNGCCLPIGPLREPESKLDRVDCVVLRDGSNGFLLTMDGIHPANDLTIIHPLHYLKGKKVNLVAGVGNRSKLINKLIGLNIDVHPIDVADHGAIRLNERSEGIWLVTMKDWVKLQHCSDLSNLYVIRSNCSISDYIQSFIDGLCQSLVQ
jgi:tetraacyldisaccharide 4'-kinase